MGSQYTDAKKYTAIRADMIGLSMSKYQLHRIGLTADYHSGGIYTGTIYECKAYLQGATQYITAEAVGSHVENRVLCARLAQHLADISYTAYKLQWATKRENYAPVRADLTDELRDAYQRAQVVITALSDMAPQMPSSDDVSIDSKREIMAQITRELTEATSKAMQLLKGL